ncbi:response regulator transcription factor [Seonamhaeicola algicola]|uniref:Response regulator transcription factor n=1 Tax=Seonamhaeicola algicola TaxID=1719036 RepID=A0A5C7AKU9_9FLAO|nr:response regulator [Seonamhaeicola algicola]TXE07195.1 response regulator transcription factor [Seonamhaeicola algicola]
MGEQSIKLLIIEDHQIIAQAYKNILTEIPEINFSFTFANNCDDAISKILKEQNDLFILDLQLPISTNERFLSGEDLSLLIREKLPDAKIIILTSITDLARISSIIKELNPEGFMIKSDIESKELKDAVITVINNKTYYSKTIENYVSTSVFNDLIIDDFDRQILYHLSMGEKTKDLTKFIPLSTRAIEVRKNKLKTLLDTKDSNEGFNLVKSAKKLGLI